MLAQRLEAGEALANLTRELIVQRRQPLLLDLFDDDGERPSLPRERLGAGRSGYGHLFGHPFLGADNALRETGQEDGDAVTRCELEIVVSEHLAPVDLAADFGSHQVASLHRAFHRLMQGVAVASLLHRLVYVLLGHDDAGPAEAQLGVVTQLHRRTDGDGSLEEQRLLLDDVQLRLVYHLDLLLLQGLVVGLGYQNIKRLVHQSFPAHVALQHTARGLPFAKAGDIGALYEATVSPIQGALHLVRLDLDLQDHLTFGDAFDGNPHGFDYITRVPQDVALRSQRRLLELALQLPHIP